MTTAPSETPMDPVEEFIDSIQRRLLGYPHADVREVVFTHGNGGRLAFRTYRDESPTDRAGLIAAEVQSRRPDIERYLETA